MIYALLILILIAVIRGWLTATIKRAVVSPVAPDGKLLGAVLSEKVRWKAIKEDHGIAIGFWMGVTLALWLAWAVG